MYEETTAHYRLLATAYRRYLDTDLRLAIALEEMQAIFPDSRKPYRGAIGSPRSRIRRLRDERDRALLRLQSSYAIYSAAKSRVEERQSRRVRTLFLGFLAE